MLQAHSLGIGNPSNKCSRSAWHDANTILNTSVYYDCCLTCFLDVLMRQHRG